MLDVVSVRTAATIELGACAVSIVREKNGRFAIDLPERGRAQLHGPTASQALAAGGRHGLGTDQVLMFEVGDLSLEIRHVPSAPFLNRPVLTRLDYAWTNTLVVSLFVHALLGSVALATPRASAADVEELPVHSRFREVVYLPETAKPTIPDGDYVPASAGALGQVGRPDRPRPATGERSTLGRDRARADRALRLLGMKGSAELANILVGEGGIGLALDEALSGISGPELGDSSGTLGLGTRGEGPGQGGLRLSTVGLSGPPSDGDLSYSGGRIHKSKTDIPIDFDDPTIVGGLDKSLIQRVIKEHISQIRFCFERQLLDDPGLSGKIAMRWTITAEGKTRNVGVQQSTVGDPRLERCIVSKIRSWKFPKPRGGGVVIVNYPFILHRSG